MLIGEETEDNNENVLSVRNTANKFRPHSLADALELFRMNEKFNLLEKYIEEKQVFPLSKLVSEKQIHIF
jgi:hypothetical protein